MRFVLVLESGFHFFDTLPDLIGALSVAHEFKPFPKDWNFDAKALIGEESLDLVITGIKFSDHMNFGLSDESRKAFNEFEKVHV